jgi:hypothetical protein
MSPRSIELVEPADLVRAARTLSESAFVEDYGDAPWLAIRLPAGDIGMTAALRIGQGLERPRERSPEPLDFHTEVLTFEDLKVLEEPKSPAPSTEPNHELLEAIRGGSYFRPLRKRAGVQGALGDRVSIGRAFNQDIVLRHASVSKFHAYFQCAGSVEWSGSDAGSRNGTAVNGTRLSPRGPRTVVNGDRVKFGSIETLFLDVRTVWRLLRAL